MPEHTLISAQPQTASAGAAAALLSAQEVSEQYLYKESLQRLPLQRKLAIGATDDPLEYEADAMADKVMRMPETTFIQRKCTSCTNKEELQRKPLAASITPFIQTKASGNSNASDNLTAQINATKGTGNSMDHTTRSFMENGFGTDFSAVNIHTGDYAVQMSKELNAQAFTIGNDVYFNSGKYTPGSESGKHLLAHELTHTIQQGAGNTRLMNKIQRLCSMDFSSYTGATCQGTIQVGATTISTPIAGYYHLFILYTDNSGNRFYLRGGPGSGGTGYGNISVNCNPYDATQREYSDTNLLENIYTGADACDKLRTMQNKINEIEGWNIPYVPAGPNSNSVVATLLHDAGLPLRKPAVPTPGFEMEVTSTGGAALQQERPTTLTLGVGGGNGLLLNAELLQRLYTFSPVVAGGIPLPIPLDLQVGAYGMPNQSRFGGSLGVGTNISLFNLPFMPRITPLGVGLGAGATAGGVGTPTGIDPEMGAYFRAGIYADISRFRIAPAYQYNYFRNLSNGSDANIHSFLLQLGYTF